MSRFLRGFESLPGPLQDPRAVFPQTLLGCLVGERTFHQHASVVFSVSLNLTNNKTLTPEQIDAPTTSQTGH